MALFFLHLLFYQMELLILKENQIINFLSYNFFMTIILVNILAYFILGVIKFDTILKYDMNPTHFLQV